MFIQKYTFNVLPHLQVECKNERERKREGERKVKIVSRDVNNYHASNLQKVINKKSKKKKLNFDEQLKS